MASKAESAVGSERKGRIIGFLRRFNKISAAVFAAAGVVLQNAALLGLAAFDVAQNYALSRYEKWRGRRQARSAQKAGRIALAGV